MEHRQDQLLDRMDRRFDAMESRMDRRFDAMESRMDSRFDAVNGRCDALNTQHRSDFLWLIAVQVGAIGGLLAAMARGFHWI